MTEDAPTRSTHCSTPRSAAVRPSPSPSPACRRAAWSPGMMQTTIGGQTVWTARASGGNASLQALLAGITITPPPNWNDNQGPFSFSTTLTTYDQGGGRNDASLTLTPPVTRCRMRSTSSPSAVGAVEDAAASISLTLANPEDGAASQVVGGKVPHQHQRKRHDGQRRCSQHRRSAARDGDQPAGLPPGTYYVVPVSAAQRRSPCSIRRANASGHHGLHRLRAGPESNATTNVTTSQISGSVTISPVNDTVTISAPNVGRQRRPARAADDRRDAGRSVRSGGLGNPEQNVPDGVLVHGAGAPGALAINRGGNWGLPLVAGPCRPMSPCSRPPTGAGTISGLQVGVWSGEPGLDPTLTTATLDVTVNGVADGIGLTPTLLRQRGARSSPSTSTASCPTATTPKRRRSPSGPRPVSPPLRRHGAARGGLRCGTDTHTLTGLTPAQVTGLGVIQKDGSYRWRSPRTPSIHRVPAPRQR